MKLTILGGGGFRVPLVHEAVATAATGLTVDEIALHDVDPERLATISAVIEEQGARLAAEGRAAALPRLIATTDLCEAVAGADFVFSAVRVGGAEARTIDERVALGLGLLGQETIGPGGLAYALRTLPVALEIARTISELAPSAWTINFTNPAGIVTEAMRSVLGDRVVGICDTPIGLVRRVGRLLGADLVAGERGAEVDYVGLNHLGWLRSVRLEGTERLPDLLADDAALEEIEEARLIGKDWVRADGALPNEYLFYYLHTSDAIERITGAATTRGEFLAKQQGDFYLAAAEADGRGPEARASGHAGAAGSAGRPDGAGGAGGEGESDSCCASPLALWRETLHEREATYMAESRDEERREEDVAGGGYQEVAMRLMTALATGRPERMILDVGNIAAGREDAPASERIVPELPADCVLEVLCEVDGDGVHPLPIAPVELGRLGMMSTLRAAERKILEAATTGSREAAWQGFATHPLVSSPELGRKLLEGYEAGHPQIAALFSGR
ncbi:MULTISPECIES: 6-phospho-beta-glucosidase [Brachybacterium]|uniref:6-phospho-beta-glucosidase n=2 Tax=Brachybacterium TaxID=43668 RepID=A0A426SLY3_9MICO|nr:MULTISPECIES: 6-phospho-beta-glucosidase [Brachybacterium]RRR19127.1 6-phospho-beta-glucosidase [Brachybacterium paraconglomeratum]GLI29562.1 6-phospho-beta-glucosidase [Brachybacterium conglomeratum]GLK06202.1 6-phospho-beta-glucosidase [Brachybacterium conglomeratum]